jgi:FkbM family methyltransferase
VPENNTMREGFSRWSTNTPIGTVIDVGASSGVWSLEAMGFWPGAQYHLIEARGHHHEASLRRMAAEHSNVRYKIAAASDKPGTVYFHDSPDPYGGVAAHAPFGDCGIEVPATTIDAEIRTHALPAPYLVKLDTHGFEVPILEGASETLRQTSLLIVEVYNFTLIDGCLRFWEMCAWLEQRGFRCLDIVDLMRRRDDAFWQMDMFFAPVSRLEFRSNSYDAVIYG